jgi:TIR domain-containing protein
MVEAKDILSEARVQGYALLWVATIFLSYRREDSAGHAGRLCESLERRLGKHQVFRDVDTIRAGEDFVDAIQARLHDCQAMLVLIGREWLDAADAFRHRRIDQENDYLRLEIATGLALPGVLVVPVLVEGMAMPLAEDLPETIRALGRRQAVSLRDETWDADVDRLVAAVTGSSPARATRAKAAALVVAVLAIAVLAATFMARRFRGVDGDVLAENGNSRSDAASPTPGRTEGAGSTGAPASAITIPRAAEIVGADIIGVHIIYTLLSGSVARHGDTTTLDLRFRFSNDGSTDMLIGDGAFRLATGSTVLVPTSGLLEVVASHSVRQGVIRFQLPAGTREAVLRVRIQAAAAELPLDLSSTGRPAETDRADTGDALSRAILAPLVSEPRPLIARTGIGYTLTRATVRRFVNALRIVINIRMTNRSPIPWYFGASGFRLLVDGQATAPVDGPSLGVASNSDASGDVVFDVPPSARMVILRVTEQGSVAEVPLDLPSVTR